MESKAYLQWFLYSSGYTAETEGYTTGIFNTKQY